MVHMPEATVTGADAGETLFASARTVAVITSPCLSKLVERPVSVQVPFASVLVDPITTGVLPPVLLYTVIVDPDASTDEPVMEVLLASIGLATTGGVAAICGKADVCSVLREVGGNTPIKARHAAGAL